MSDKEKGKKKCTMSLDDYTILCIDQYIKKKSFIESRSEAVRYMFKEGQYEDNRITEEKGS